MRHLGMRSAGIAGIVAMSVAGSSLSWGSQDEPARVARPPASGVEPRQPARASSVPTYARLLEDPPQARPASGNRSLELPITSPDAAPISRYQLLDRMIEVEPLHADTTQAPKKAASTPATKATASPKAATSAPGDAGGNPAAVPTYPAPSAYRIDPALTKLTFQYRTKKRAQGGFDIENGSSASKELAIEAASIEGLLPREVMVEISLKMGKNQVPFGVKTKVAWDPKTMRYVVPSDVLNQMAAKLVEDLNGILGKFDGDTPITFDAPASLKILPVVDDLKSVLVAQAVTVAGSVPIEMRQVVGAGEAYEIAPAAEVKPPGN